ncbi:unnamed protein product, partial [Brugia pahangi]|uniref:MADF domain-containing protein n=1 Tax=Brugia pahangi TaxID=6280 RepID=A0A0N4T6Q2_BRUPA
MSAQFVYGGIIASVRVCERKLSSCYIFCGLPTEQAVRSEARIDCDVAAVGAASGDDGSGDEEVENGAVRYSDAGNSSVMSLKGGPDSTFNDSLIREVRLNPIIYDFSHPLYGNAIKKQETWIEIA